jgi:hypothetical protein
LYARDNDENFSTALNVLTLLAMRDIPSTIEDTMYAYMVAKDWSHWIKNPNSPDDVDNFMPDRKAEELRPMLDVLEGYAGDFEDQFVRDADDIKEYLKNLNPNLINFWRGSYRHLNIKEDARMLFRALRYMAEFFASVGDNHFSELLDAKNVPPMSELNKKNCF